VKITKLLTPILPHTAEEIWSYLEHEAEEFVQLAEMPEVETFANEAQLLADWENFMVFRTQAQKALEEARNAKVIGKSLEAHLTAYVSAETKSFLESLNADLAQLLIVSNLTVTTETAPSTALVVDEVAFAVERAAGEVCDRCRRIDTSVAERSYGATICDHCASVVEENFAEAVAQGFEA
ncbi:TPA: class I tRNA ligase family protein, partial [Streptococcus suis]